MSMAFYEMVGQAKADAAKRADAETNGLVEHRAVEMAQGVIGNWMVPCEPNDAIVRAVRAGFDEAAATITRLTAERDEARAECERLRDVLEQAQAVLDVLGFGADEPICCKIRAALAPKEPK